MASMAISASVRAVSGVAASPAFPGSPRRALFAPHGPTKRAYACAPSLRRERSDLIQ